MLTGRAPQPLLLLGAGGLAREVLAAARCSPHRWQPVGALDDDPRRHGADLDGIPVLGPVAAVTEHPEAALVACVANVARPGARTALVRRLTVPDERWATVVHPSTSLPEGCEIGPGTVLLAGCVLTTPLRVGAHVVAMPMLLLTHDVAVGDGVTFAGRVTLGGGVAVGEDAYLGQGSTVRENVRIGPRAVVGMGAVVLYDVPADQTWVGAPARRLFPRSRGVSDSRGRTAS